MFKINQTNINIYCLVSTVPVGLFLNRIGSITLCNIGLSVHDEHINTKLKLHPNEQIP